MNQPTAVESSRPGFRIGILVRIILLCILLLADKLILEALVDERRAQSAQGLGALVRQAQHWGLRFLVTFIAAASVLALVRTQSVSTRPGIGRHLPPVAYRWISVHVLLMAALAPLSYVLYRAEIPRFGFAMITAACAIVCAAAVMAAGIALVPAPIWLREGRRLGLGWLYAATIALLGTGAWLESEKLWESVTAVTFELVKWLLIPVLPAIIVDPSTRVISAPHFAIEITDVCSGLEGLGLTLAFSVMWLVCFRREYVFPRALVLIPASMAAIFLLNAIRIAALLGIGNAGYPEVASYGFHSQAGWIAFNAVACALVLFSRRSRWLNRTASAAEVTEVHNPTAAYLAPLLAILAAGMLSHALSGRFERFYPLRLIIAAAAFYVFRRPLLALPWRATWRGPFVGAGVFILWVGAARWLLPTATAPEALVAMLPFDRDVWIVSRCLTSVAIVPIAEELAYRGYLMRRLMRSEFETVSYRAVGWPALSVTAVVFGAAHGALWAAGILAGLAYGLLAIRRASLGEAVAAHATTNGIDCADSRLGQPMATLVARLGTGATEIHKPGTSPLPCDSLNGRYPIVTKTRFS